MFKSLQQFFKESLPANKEPDANALNLAAAALMVELIYIDDNIAASERNKLITVLEKQLAISHSQVLELVALAEKTAGNAHDFYQFTRLINDNYSYPLKCQLIESLWQLAYADNALDKYEESMIRKIADLLYIEHADFIRAKQRHKTS
jgi:uncharacterized tellurite resistance protein B-like protein